MFSLMFSLKYNIFYFLFVYYRMRKQHKTADGKLYENLVGSRAQVYHGTAYKTSGGLKKSDLVQNKRGRIVSKKKLETAKREKRLEKYGYFAEKGKFGAVRRSPRKSSRRKAHTVRGKTRRRHR
jgi:hypothetical protein